MRRKACGKDLPFSLLFECDRLDRTNIDRFLAIACITFVRAYDMRFPIFLHFEDFRTYLLTGTASFTRLFMDNRFCHFKYLLNSSY
jgi:hypothetical protein